MGVVLLLDELKAFTESIVKDYWLETDKGSQKPPQVITGYLPYKNDSDVPDFPYVILRLVEGTDTKDGATVTVKMIIGIYSEDEQNGWRDVANLIQRIWSRLFKKRFLAKKYEVQYPMEFVLPDEQPIPYWIGVMTTRWTVARPVMEGLGLGEEV